MLYHEHSPGHHHALSFFNEVLALLGALGFWPLKVYFPIEMYIAQKGVRRKVFHQVGVLEIMLELRMLPHLLDRGLCLH